MKSQPFSILKRLHSFSFAYNGFRILFKEEHNARIHLIASILAILFSFYFELNNLEWVGILLSIGMVFSAEIFNSAIENLCDFVSPHWHDKIKKVKDLSAAAVLLSAIISASIGLIIFLPKWIAMLK